MLHMVSEPKLKHSGLFGLKKGHTHIVLETNDRVLFEITGINKFTLIQNLGTLRCANYGYLYISLPCNHAREIGITSQKLQRRWPITFTTSVLGPTRYLHSYLAIPFAFKDVLRMTKMIVSSLLSCTKKMVLVRYINKPRVDEIIMENF